MNGVRSVALSGQRLYLLSVAVPDEGDAATGTLRMVRVAPDMGAGEVEASYKASPLRNSPRDVTWRFKLSDGRGNGIGLTLKTYRNFDRSIVEPELAKALAEALGWQFPGELSPDTDAG